jgi:hypothetical protein
MKKVCVRNRTRSIHLTDYYAHIGGRRCHHIIIISSPLQMNVTAEHGYQGLTCILLQIYVHTIRAVLVLCNGVQSFTNTWAMGNLSIALIFKV